MEEGKNTGAPSGPSQSAEPEPVPVSALSGDCLSRAGADRVIKLARQYAANRREAGDLYTATWFEDFAAEAEEGMR